MSSRGRGILIGALGFVTVACTTITGADDLSIEEHGQAVGQAEPEQNGTRIGRPSDSDDGSGSGAGSSGSNGSSGSTPPTNPTIPPPPPPPPIDAGSPLPDTKVSIGCGQQTCAGATPYCCASVGSYTCVAAGAECTGNRYRLTCDGAEDCGIGEACCALFGGPNEGSRCMPATNCKGPSPSHARMCTSTAQCFPGQACVGFIVDDNGVRLDLSAGLCID